jgi:PhnB protein
MQLGPYLTFNGQCETAFKFYENCLGGKIQGIFNWAGTPGAEMVPAEWRDKVMHATLVIGNFELMGTDAPPDQYKKPQGFSIMLEPKDAAEAERIFNQLSEKGTVKVPLAETFWAERFGMVVDQFDIPWMINLSLGPSKG